jgi:hypothetical protein
MEQSNPQPEDRKRKSALERAQEDLDHGRPDKARDRITGYLYTLHRRGEYNQEAYSLLGQVYFAMRDLPRAGAAWLLTERQGADVDEALKAFTQRYGSDAANVLYAIKPHAPSEDYPQAVQERLKSWGYRYRLYRPRSNPHAAHELSAEPKTTGVRPVELGCFMAMLAVFSVFAYWLYLNFFSR